MRTAVDPRPETLGLPEADFRTRYAAAVIGSIPAWQIGLLVMAFAVWDLMVSPAAAPTTFLIRSVATLVLVIVVRYVASPATSLRAHRIALIGIPLVITASITLVMILTRADPLYLVATVGIIAYAFGILQGSLARGILLALAIDAIVFVAIGMAALPPERFWTTVVFLSFPVGAVAVGNRFNGDMLRRLQEVEAASIAIGSFFSDASATAGDDREAFTMLARRTREALGADCLTALLSADGRSLDPVASATAGGVRSLGAGSPDAREVPVVGADGRPAAMSEPDEDGGRDAIATWFARWRDVDAGPARDIVRRGVALAAEDAAALTDGLVPDARTASLTGTGAPSASRTGSGGRSHAADAAGAAGAAPAGAAGAAPAGAAGAAPAGAAGAEFADRIWRGLPAGVTAIAPGPGGISVFERSGPRCRMLVLPVRRDDVVVGIVAAWRPAGARPFAASALRLLGALCDAAGIIVERRRAVGLVGDAAARLEAIFAASPIAMVLLDDRGRVQLWNAAAESLTGWASRDVLGRQVDAFATGTRDELTEVLGSVLAGATVNDRQLDGRRRDGAPLHVALHLAPVRDGTGRIVGAIAEVIDIAPRMRLETELLQAQKLESVGRLAGGIAHDFNNMLTAIIGAASMLEVELGPERRARREVEAIQLAADRAAQLTRQLLGFARKAVLAPTDVDLNAIVLGIEPMLERLLGERIAVVTRLDPGAGGVSVDRAQVEQVLVNLAVNARDAMPDGGALLFRTSRLDRSDLPAGLDVADTGRVAVLTVSDTGFGMSDEVRRHAFDPFYTTKEVGQGTGLGLATSYGIIRQSGGDIAVETKPGEGTTFRIYLPAAATAPVPSRAVVGGCPSRSPGGTILLAEDEPNVRDLVRRILERAGYAVLEAPNGEAALSIAGGSGRIDLLLSDVVMPGLSGPELHDRMARSRPDLPVVFMSGYVANPDVREALGSREVPLIAKPFATETLLAAVASALRPADGVPAEPGGSPAEPGSSPIDARA